MQRLFLRRFLLPATTLLCFTAPVPVPLSHLLAAALPLQNRIELLNGLKVVVAERGAQTTASVALVTFAGADADEPGKAGTASLTARMLLAATSQRGRDQILADLAEDNLRASSEADHDASWFRVSGNAKEIGSMLELVSDLVFTSNFDEKELVRLKERVKNELRARRATPEGLAEIHFREKLFGMHPYGFSPEGVERTLNEITKADCLKFYQRYYHPNNALLLIVGGVRMDDILSKIRVLFGGWRHLPVPAILPKYAQQPVGVRIRVVDFPTVERAVIRLGRLGVERAQRDFYNLEVLNFILGGEGFASRFSERLQKKESWAKTVSSAFEYHVWPGLWRTSASVAPANAASAVVAILDELQRIQNSKVTEDELREAVQVMSERFSSQLESNDQILEALARMEIYSLALDTVVAYTPHLLRVSTEELQRAARQYLDSASLVVVVIGSAAEMKAALEKIGPVEVYPAN